MEPQPHLVDDDWREGSKRGEEDGPQEPSSLPRARIWQSVREVLHSTFAPTLRVARR